MTFKQFTFAQLDKELQGEIVGFLDWFDWGMMRLTNKAMHNLCNTHKVKKEVFGPNMYFDEMVLPKEYAWMEETTKGTPLSTYSLEYGYIHYPHFVIGCAYNPFGKDLGPDRWLEWQRFNKGETKDLPKQYFAMCVNAETDKRMGYFEALYFGKENVMISSQPNSEYGWHDYDPQRNGRWEKWDFQYFHKESVESNFIPCEMWVMPLDKYDSKDDIDLVEDIVHFFPSFEGVALLRTKEDLLALYERVKALPLYI